MTTCTKLYTDLPFAHRQPNHDGHCAYLHGHNWSFEIEFASSRKDECGFVIDFGKLKPVKAWFEQFDHALVLNEDDPMLEYFKATLVEPKLDQRLGFKPLARIVEVPDCSCEGLAEYALKAVDIIVQEMTGGRVHVRRVTCFEDSKNSATARRDA